MQKKMGRIKEVRMQNPHKRGSLQSGPKAYVWRGVSFFHRNRYFQNQIDIRLATGRTIEVRSSCVRNGIEFAVFMKKKEIDGQQYFDVIGPYTNGYKPGKALRIII